MAEASSLCSSKQSQDGSATFKFENHALTSFAGLVLFQQRFATLDLKARLRGCLRHGAGGKAFGPATLFLQLIVHIVLGFREWREARAYRDDPRVQRLLGLRRLPDVATVSRRCQLSALSFQLSAGITIDGPTLLWLKADS